MKRIVNVLIVLLAALLGVLASIFPSNPPLVIPGGGGDILSGDVINDIVFYDELVNDTFVRFNSSVSLTVFINTSNSSRGISSAKAQLVYPDNSVENLTIRNYGQCYQTSINDYTICDNRPTNTTIYCANWSPSYPCSNIYDGSYYSYGTPVYAGTMASMVWWNKVPVNTFNAILELDIYNPLPPANFSIPDNCSQTIGSSKEIKFRLLSLDPGTDYTRVECEVGGNYQSIALIEEAINGDRPTMVRIFWNSSKDGNFTFKTAPLTQVGNYSFNSIWANDTYGDENSKVIAQNFIVSDDVVLINESISDHYPHYRDNVTVRATFEHFNSYRSIDSVWMMITLPNGTMINLSLESPSLSSATWIVSDGYNGASQGPFYLSIPALCLSQDYLQFRIGSHYSGTAGNVSWDCWNGTAWYELRNSGNINNGGDVFEEAINWSYSDGSYCYQETATSLVACGSSVVGSYAYTSNWYEYHPASMVYDSNWSSYGRVVGSHNDSYVYVNYSKPTTHPLNRLVNFSVDYSGNYTINRFYVNDSVGEEYSFDSSLWSYLLTYMNISARAVPAGFQPFGNPFNVTALVGFFNRFISGARLVYHNYGGSDQVVVMSESWSDSCVQHFPQETVCFKNDDSSYSYDDVFVYSRDPFEHDMVFLKTNGSAVVYTNISKPPHAGGVLWGVYSGRFINDSSYESTVVVLDTTVCFDSYDTFVVNKHNLTFNGTDVILIFECWDGTAWYELGRYNSSSAFGLVYGSHMLNFSRHENKTLYYYEFANDVYNIYNITGFFVNDTFGEEENDTTGWYWYTIAPSPQLFCNGVMNIEFITNISRGTYNPATNTYTELNITATNQSVAGCVYLINNSGYFIPTVYSVWTNNSESNIKVYANDVLINMTHNLTINIEPFSVAYVNLSIDLINYPLTVTEKYFSINVTLVS